NHINKKSNFRSQLTSALPTLPKITTAPKQQQLNNHVSYRLVRCPHGPCRCPSSRCRRSSVLCRCWRVLRLCSCWLPLDQEAGHPLGSWVRRWYRCHLCLLLPESEEGYHRLGEWIRSSLDVVSFDQICCPSQLD
ncbi:MAG: hypothetical protein J3R72DRAFT_518697, partial [Linnemannia gamsii]